jgi:hypothetical protein
MDSGGAETEVRKHFGACHQFFTKQEDAEKFIKEWNETTKLRKSSQREEVTMEALLSGVEQLHIST